MIQQQIQDFTNSLQSIATEYSDPSVLLQHIPVMRDYPFLQQNPELLGYGIAGLFTLLFLRRILKKRRKAKTKNIAMIMPKPYEGEAEKVAKPQAAISVAAPTKPDSDEDPRILALETRPARNVARKKDAPRSAEQKIADVRAVSYLVKTSLTPDEARIRVMVQSLLNELGTGFTAMSRVSLAALLQPGQEAVGPGRAHAQNAINDKFIEFGIFDRVGRLVVAIDVDEQQPSKPLKSKDRAIVQAALGQAGISCVTLKFGETLQQMRDKLAPHLRLKVQAASVPTTIAAE